MDHYKKEDVHLRYSELSDGPFIEKWLYEPGVLRGFPLKREEEIKEAVKYWIGFSQYRSSLTAEINNKPCGVATINLMPYTKICHHCLLSIIVGEEFRNKGVGTILLNNLLHLAKNVFKLDVAYIEVYEGNPAISLYRRFGFKEVGFQKHFLKDDGKYIGKITMERTL